MQLNPKKTAGMDDNPFIAWNFLNVANTWPKPKEIERVVFEEEEEEESNVSLELSLSLDNNTSNDQYKRKERTMKYSSMSRETSCEDFSLELSDISLKLSLSGPGKRKSPAPALASALAFATDEGNRWRFEVGECSTKYQKEHNCLKPKNIIEGLSLQLNLGSDDTCTSSKKKEIRMGNPSTRTSSSSSSSSSSRRKFLSYSYGNKRYKLVEDGEEKRNGKEAVVTTELRIGPDPWCFKKQLFESDLGNMSRLMLTSEFVESHVFPFWNADQLTKIKQGLPVSVWDCDTKTEHVLIFKQWNKGANVLIKNWVKSFVKRRELKLGDEIGLFWDNYSSRFKFAVLNRAARH